MIGVLHGRHAYTILRFGDSNHYWVADTLNQAYFRVFPDLDALKLHVLYKAIKMVAFEFQNKTWTNCNKHELFQFDAYIMTPFHDTEKETEGDYDTKNKNEEEITLLKIRNGINSYVQQRQTMVLRSASAKRSDEEQSGVKNQDEIGRKKRTSD